MHLIVVAAAAVAIVGCSVFAFGQDAVPVAVPSNWADIAGPVGVVAVLLALGQATIWSRLLRSEGRDTRRVMERVADSMDRVAEALTTLRVAAARTEREDNDKPRNGAR